MFNHYIYIREREDRPRYPTYEERMRKARYRRANDLTFNIIPALERQVHKNPMARLQLKVAKKELADIIKNG